jgi:hypothetical protein
MWTKIRILIIILFLFILFIFGVDPYMSYFKGVSENKIITILMSFLFLSSLTAIVWYTQLIYFDLSKKKITLLYPLRFRMTTFDFDDILGYCYKYHTSSRKITTKTILFKVKKGVIFSISSFETSNLREIEKMCLETFDLRSEYNFSELNIRGKESRISASKEFDIKEAKDVKIALLLILVLIIFCLFLMVLISAKSYQLNYKSVAGIVILIFLFVSIISKIIRQNGIIKNSA